MATHDANEGIAAWMAEARAPLGGPMKRVTGIGGVFLQGEGPEALGEWYRTHLGIDLQDWGGNIGTMFPWDEPPTA